jgi:hypothetical protein
MLLSFHSLNNIGTSTHGTHQTRRKCQLATSVMTHLLYVKIAYK